MWYIIRGQIKTGLDMLAGSVQKIPARGAIDFFLSKWEEWFL